MCQVFRVSFLLVIFLIASHFFGGCGVQDGGGPDDLSNSNKRIVAGPGPGAMMSPAGPATHHPVVPWDPWKYPKTVDQNISPDGKNASSPVAAMNITGDTVIAWAQENGTHSQIFVSEYRNDVWAHPADLNDSISPKQTSAFGPMVAMNNLGNAIIVWYQWDGSCYRILKSEYQNGLWTHPTSPTDAISPSGQSAYDPVVAMDDWGESVVAWEQKDEQGTWQIFLSEYRNNLWHNPADLSDNITLDGLDALDPQVDMANNRKTLVVWRQNDGSDDAIFKSEYVNGTWFHPATPNDNISPSGGDARRPMVAMATTDSAAITWYQGSIDNQIYLSEYRNSHWTHPASLSDHINPVGAFAAEPFVTMDNRDNTIITWQQNDLFKSEYRKGKWTHPKSLADHFSPGSGGAHSPWIATSAYGEALITWVQPDSVGWNQIFKSEYR